MLFLKLRYQFLRNQIIQGWYEVPYLYFTMGIVACSAVGISYKWSLADSTDHFYMQYKLNYLVVRPSDARLKKYPQEFITDIGVLKNYENEQEKLGKPVERSRPTYWRE